MNPGGRCKSSAMDKVQEKVSLFFFFFYSKIFVPPTKARCAQHIHQNKTVFLDIICLIVTKSKSAWNQLQNLFLKNKIIKVLFLIVTTLILEPEPRL